MRCAPACPADLYTCQTSGVYSIAAVEAPFASGHDCVGVVTNARFAHRGGVFMLSLPS